LHSQAVSDEDKACWVVEDLTKISFARGLVKMALYQIYDAKGLHIC